MLLRRAFVQAALAVLSRVSDYFSRGHRSSLVEKWRVERVGRLLWCTRYDVVPRISFVRRTFVLINISASWLVLNSRYAFCVSLTLVRDACLSYQVEGWRYNLMWRLRAYRPCFINSGDGHQSKKRVTYATSGCRVVIIVDMTSRHTLAVYVPLSSRVWVRQRCRTNRSFAKSHALRVDIHGIFGSVCTNPYITRSCSVLIISVQVERTQHPTMARFERRMQYLLRCCASVLVSLQTIFILSIYNIPIRLIFWILGFKIYILSRNLFLRRVKNVITGFKMVLVDWFSFAHFISSWFLFYWIILLAKTLRPLKLNLNTDRGVNHLWESLYIFL